MSGEGNKLNNGETSSSSQQHALTIDNWLDALSSLSRSLTVSSPAIPIDPVQQRHKGRYYVFDDDVDRVSYHGYREVRYKVRKYRRCNFEKKPKTSSQQPHEKQSRETTVSSSPPSSSYSSSSSTSSSWSSDEWHPVVSATSSSTSSATTTFAVAATQQYDTNTTSVDGASQPPSASSS